jgi:hypothetical protein
VKPYEQKDGVAHGGRHTPQAADSSLDWERPSYLIDVSVLHFAPSYPPDRCMVGSYSGMAAGTRMPEQSKDIACRSTSKIRIAE